MAAALAELQRVLGDGGRAARDRPCGPEQDFGWYVRLPAESWRRLFERCGFAIVEDEVYVRTGEGWRTIGATGAVEGCFCAELEQRSLLALAADAAARGPALEVHASYIGSQPTPYSASA